MLELEEKEKTKIELPIKTERIRVACLKALSELTVKVKERIKESLTKFLEAWEPSEDALEKYPFLRDTNKFVSDYISCIQVEANFKENTILLRVNKEKLKDFGFPEKITQILEYGNPDLPPFPHIRTSMQGVETIAIDIAKKYVRKEVA